MRIKKISRCKNYSKKQKRLVNKLKPWNGSLWDEKELEDLKKGIKAYMSRIQDERCAYCGNRFGVTSNSEIEHIAPKGGSKRLIYPQFTLTPYNLVLACHLCNSPVKKGQIKVISNLDINYRNCEFKIVHPYFDDPSEHFIEMTSPDGKSIIYAYTSKKGLNSVKMFSLNNEPQVIARTSDILISNMPEGLKKDILAAYMMSI
ncbi:HNH endonuclease [Vagococcus fluvialis]|uniref:HNH endonuclease n=1 Tax=Vagococcus fluvialis TaxID=2738 RepID=UPI001A8F705D|nr:HNH endonuclease [Vagococcus fluvialis]MBO0444251.1 HNH endonuclease [Vagococcus fluvialis]